MIDHYLETSDLSQMFRVSTATASRWIKHCGLPARQVKTPARGANPHYIDPLALVRWLIANSRNLHIDYRGALQVRMGQQSKAALAKKKIHYKPGKHRPVTIEREPVSVSAVEKLTRLENERMPAGMKWVGDKLVCRSDSIKL